MTRIFEILASFITFCISQIYYGLSYLVQLFSFENVVYILRSHRGHAVSNTTNIDENIVRKKHRL